MTTVYLMHSISFLIFEGQGVIMVGIYSEFVPVHVQVSELSLVPEGEIEIYKPSGGQPVTKYRISPAQIEKVNEYFAQKTRYSPWAFRKKSYMSKDSFHDTKTGFSLDFKMDTGDWTEEESKEKSRSREKTRFNKTGKGGNLKKRQSVICPELAAGGL
ncbi:hypothetical protein SDD30_16230 [Moorella naiadis]|uniref:hypothetical protein n=1 Tax=Moorella naiadis (nom. illeg.) TaxID=3093670 RepID=UPI003D9C83E5